MPISIRHQLLLATLSAAMFFLNLGAVHLWDIDEAIFSQAAKEMFERGDHVVPYFNGKVFPDKPAMMYWLMISAYELFGANEFAARFWSAVAGIGSVLLTYRLGRLLFSPSTGFWAGLILATSLNFNVIARAATPDSFLVFFSTLAMLLFVLGTAKARPLSGELNERNAPWAGQTRFEPSWPAYALIYAAMGLGVLTKGPIGVVLPTAVLGLFLLVMRAEPIAPSTREGWRGAGQNALRWMVQVFGIRHFFRTLWSMRPLTAIVMVLAVAAPWYVLVGLRTDGEWLVGFFGVHNFGRFLNAMENHRGPIFYYLIAVSIGFFPWSVLFAPGFLHIKRQVQENSPWRPGIVLACSWLAVWVGFFSLAGTKLPSYVVPAYPALALLGACFVHGWLREPSTLSPLWTRMAWSCVVLTGVGMLIALPIIGRIYLAGDWVLGLIGLLPLVAGIAGWILSTQGRSLAAATTLASLGMAMAMTIFGFAALRVDDYLDTPYLARTIAENTPPGGDPVIGSYRYFRPSFVFYADDSVEQFDESTDVPEFFASHPESAFVLTTESHYSQFRDTLPPDVTVLEARARFLGSGQILLLGRRLDSATAKHPQDAAPKRF